MNSSESDKSNWIEINTYKSIWFQNIDTGNYKRKQKDKYVFEGLILKTLLKIPKIRAFFILLGRKPQGVDFYKSYTKMIENGEYEEYASGFNNVESQLKSLGYNLDDSKILDISGEPGFFAKDAMSLCKSVEVTAFAEEVSKSMADVLGLNSKKYDFQTDDLTKMYNKGVYDFIFIRYAIGFCVDLKSFIDQCHKLLSNGGIIYVSFSPASRGVCARWMFDDYTYLRQYTTENLIKSFITYGFEKIGDFDEGSNKWDKNIHPFQKLYSKLYTKEIFADCDSGEFFQHNTAILFKKI